MDMPRLRCLRCGHEWFPRRAQKPKVCRSCGSRDWDKPKGTPASAGIDQTTSTAGKSSYVKAEYVRRLGRIFDSQNAEAIGRVAGIIDVFLRIIALDEKKDPGRK